MDNAEIEEMFSSLGPITIRRMFGGKGIYHRGHILALEVSDEILQGRRPQRAEVRGRRRDAMGVQEQDQEGGQNALLVDPRRRLRQPRYHGEVGADGI